jgi:hypothetical protein
MLSSSSAEPVNKSTPSNLESFAIRSAEVNEHGNTQYLTTHTEISSAVYFEAGSNLNDILGA